MLKNNIEVQENVRNIRKDMMSRDFNGYKMVRELQKRQITAFTLAKLYIQIRKSS